MTVKVPTRVFKQWREISADSDKVELDLLLTSRLDPVAATALLSQSVERVLKQFEDAHPFNDPPIGDEPPFAGQWDVAPVAEGALLVGGYKSDAFEEIVGLIADELARQGVRGKLDLYARPEVPVEPRGIGTIEAHVRVLGRRVVNGRDRWAAERAALDRVLTTAVEWTLEARPDRGVTIGGILVPTLLVRRCDRALERMRNVVRDDNAVTLSSIGDERFRRVTVDFPTGGIEIVEGGPILHRAGWRPSVAAATDLLRLVSADAVYGFVRRRQNERERERLHRSSLDALAHEDHLVPDAFPIQLFSAGHLDRLPRDGDEWQASNLGEDRVLLEHADLSAWFDEVTLEDALAGRATPRQDIVDRARTSLTKLLFKEQTAEEGERRHAWDMTHPRVAVPDHIVAKVHALPRTSHVGHWDVAFVLRDGTVVEQVELGHAGETITRVAGEREFTLDPEQIIDVLQRHGSSTTDTRPP